MLTNRKYQIIQFLLEKKQPFTCAMIAQKIGVSERTIKSELHSLKSMAPTLGIEITARKGHGYQIEILDAIVFEQAMEGFHKNQIMSIEDERSNILACILLDHKTHLHLQDLEDFLFCNRSLILKSIHEIPIILKDYHLHLTSSKKGYAITGKEYNKRNCLHNLLKKKINISLKIFRFIYVLLH